MSLETIYYIGQTIAVLALIVSLFFAGVQIHQNTEQSKAAAADAAHRSFLDCYYNQWTVIATTLKGTFLPWTPACAGVGGDWVRLEPG